MYIENIKGEALFSFVYPSKKAIENCEVKVDVQTRK